MCGSVWKAAAPSSQGAQEARDNTEASCRVQLQTVLSTAACLRAGPAPDWTHNISARLDIYNSGKLQLHDTNSWVSSGGILHWLDDGDSVSHTSRLGDIHLRRKKKTTRWRQFQWISQQSMCDHKSVKWLTRWDWCWPHENSVIVLMTERERAAEPFKKFRSCKQVQRDTHFPNCLCSEVSRVVSKGWLTHVHTTTCVIRQVIQWHLIWTSIPKLNLEIWCAVWLLTWPFQILSRRAATHKTTPGGWEWKEQERMTNRLKYVQESITSL